MSRTLALLVICMLSNMFTGMQAWAQATPEVTLTRLDCGTSNPPFDPNLRFSDTWAFRGLKVQLVYSC